MPVHGAPSNTSGCISSASCSRASTSRGVGRLKISASLMKILPLRLAGISFQNSHWSRTFSNTFPRAMEVMMMISGKSVITCSRLNLGYPAALPARFRPPALSISSSMKVPAPADTMGVTPICRKTRGRPVL